MERLAKYELLSKIASGGMAEIWVARSGAEMCVIKKLLPQHADNEEFKRMFLDEGRLGAALVHPNIVRMFDFGSDKGTPYLAMEYLHGEDLRVANRVHRAEGRTMPLAQAVDIIARACAGLHHAHELRGEDGSLLELVHRDVSPHNVFLTFDGGVKVVDFGVAKSLDRRWETKHGTLKGKVPYMSPEQIKARRLDRRSDIYAMGVMLYELVLGRRPYVLSAGGDFAMMMAIARHDIRPPRALAPDLDRELEEIIVRAMTYDPRGRYPTMLEMALALERFAAKRRLETGPGPLAAYLEALFSVRVAAWRAAQHDDLAAHVLQIEEERAQHAQESDDIKTIVNEAVDEEATSNVSSSGLFAGAAPRSAASLVVSSSSAVAAVIEVSGTTVVTLHGRIDEGFEGAALGGSLSGVALFDLKGVERVTSFGVREWLEMMRAAKEQEDVDLWLARCSEPIVTQLSLIRTFSGDAKLLSFQAPFLCDDCGCSFPRVLDCERDASWFRDGRGEAPRCPRCGGAAKLDDDPALLAFAAPYAGLAVPDGIRAVLDTIEQSEVADRDVVDKVITNDETRVRVSRDVDRAIRWNRVLDGVEGKLVVDFHGASRVTAEGARNFVRGIKALGPEVSHVEIVECPVSVLVALGPRSLGPDEPKGDRLRLVSVAFAGRCLACAAARSGVVPLREVTEAGRDGRAPFVPCSRCDAALDVSEAAGALTKLFASAIDDRAPAPRSTTSAIGPPPAAPDARPRALVLRVAVAVVAGLALALIVAAVLRARAPRTAATTSPIGSSSAPAVTEGISVAVVHDAVEIDVTLRGSGDVGDVARARSRAILAIVDQLAQTLDAEVREANAAAPPAFDPAEVEARFTRDVGAFASPERVAVRAGERSMLTARYRVAQASWDQATTYYNATRELRGVTVARALPSRRAGLVVVDVDGARYPALARGAVLISLDGRPIAGLEALPRAPTPRHDALFAFGAEIIAVELK